MLKDIGERIKNARISRGYTQQQLADGIGKTRYLISKYEGAKVIPSGKCISLMARFLNVDVDYILGNDSGMSMITFYGDYFNKSNSGKILPVNTPADSDYFSLKSPMNCCNGVNVGDLLVLRPIVEPQSDETVLVECLPDKLLIGFLWLNNGVKLLITKSNEQPIDISDESKYKIVAEVIYAIKDFKGGKLC